MYKVRHIVVILVTFAGLAPAIHAAELAAPPPGSRPVPRGPWPTKRMIDAALRRMSRDVARRHKMDAKQAAVLQRQAMTRWPAFLKKHRPVLQQLVNEYLETIIIGDPPAPEQVARWAKAFQPIMAAAAQEFEGTYHEVRKALRPEQIDLWDRDHKGFRLSKKLVEAEAGRLARGQFDPRHWRTPLPRPAAAERLPVRSSSAWLPDSQDDRTGRIGRSIMSARGVAARRTGRKGPPRFGADRPSTNGGSMDARRAGRPLDAWESYVKQFIKRHELDAGQANAAMAILKELKGRARAYERKHRRELKQLKRAVAVADPSARPKFQRQLDEVRRPIDDLFDELRSRLDALLTESQREGTRP